MRVKASLARMSRILRFTPGGKYLEHLRNPECKSVTKKNSFEDETAPCLKLYPQFAHDEVFVSLGVTLVLQVDGWSFTKPANNGKLDMLVKN